MSSSHRSTRSSLRRKMVLPVTVIRSGGQEKHLAHTLDLTEVSARLGGLSCLLEPGELIEIQRGAVKAKFQVFWMGARGSAMEGQAGVRSTEPGKSIWGIHLPADETDPAIDRAVIRKEMQPTRSDVGSTEKRWHTRFECNGGASVRAEGSGFPVHGQVKDIARGGVYVETTTPLTVNAEVYVKMNVEGTPIESAGVVRTSYPMVGMGISFQNISPENQERVDEVIHQIRRKSLSTRGVTEPAMSAPIQHPSSSATPFRADAVKVLAAACRTLAADFAQWSNRHTAEELEDLRLALLELQERFAPSALAQVEYATTQTPGRHI